MKTTTYLPARRGLATEFSESGQPAEYARRLLNRFININGEPETRPGLNEHSRFFGDELFPVDGSNTKLVMLAEHIDKTGDSVLLAAETRQNAAPASTVSVITKFNDTTGQWESVEVDQAVDTTVALTLGWADQGISVSQQGKIYAAQDGDISVLVSPNIQPSYYDAMENKVYPLFSMLESGTLTAGTSTTKAFDSEITNWLAQTNVRTNDLFYNVTQKAYAIITSVGATDLDITPIRSGSGDNVGNGINGVGGNQVAGNYYQIYDLIENNVVPINRNDFDNVAIAAAGTSTSQIVVSGFVPLTNGMLQGDWIYNTTRNVVMNSNTIINQRINTSRDSLLVTSGQAEGDALIFLKSAVPVATFPHVHYSRLYLIDARDQTKVRVGAPDDPQDFTTFNLTLSSSTINYSSKQPQGEQILTLGTFQRYLVAGGKSNVYLDQGTNPIADVSGDTPDLTPVGLFSQGTISVKGLANIGSNMVFSALDGMRQFNISDILAVETDNISEAIKTELRNAIKSQLAISRDDIQVIHYPSRNWVMYKVGSTIYNFNYTALYQEGELVRGGSWSKFTGVLADCTEFLLRNDGVLMCAKFIDAETPYYQVYEFDTGSLDDAGTPIATDFETAWITPGGGQVMDTRYIKPFFEGVANKSYHITVTSDLETPYVDDTIIATACAAVSGNAIVGQAIVGQAVIGGTQTTSTNKYPLRSRGQEVKIRFQTTSGQGGDKICKFILYGNIFGIK